MYREVQIKYGFFSVARTGFRSSHAVHYSWVEKNRTYFFLIESSCLTLNIAFQEKSLTRKKGGFNQLCKTHVYKALKSRGLLILQGGTNISSVIRSTFCTCFLRKLSNNPTSHLLYYKCFVSFKFQSIIFILYSFESGVIIFHCKSQPDNISACFLHSFLSSSISIYR